jgi:hypothetical protein
MSHVVIVAGVLISSVWMAYGTWLVATGVVGVIRHWNTSGMEWEGAGHGPPSYRRLSEYAKSENRLLHGVTFLALGLLVALALAYFSLH